MTIIRLILVMLFFYNPVVFGEEPPKSIVELLEAYSQNLNPDLSKPDQRRIFALHLSHSFSGNTDQITEENLNSLRSLLKNNQGLSKPAMAPIIVEVVNIDYESTEESTQFLSSMRSLLGRAKSVFLQPDSNFGEWRKVKHNGKALFTDEQIDQFFSEQFLEKIKSENLSGEGLIMAYSTELDKLEIDAEAKLQILQRLSLIAGAIDLGDWGSKLKSKIGLTALKIAEQIIENQNSHYSKATDGRSLDADADKSSHTFRMALQSYSQTKEELAKITTEVQANKISSIHSRSMVRSLSLTESPFRSCLAQDCATQTYFSKGLDPNFIYFTRTDDEGISKGHITVVLGHAIAKSGELVEVAFIDKIQGFDIGELDLMIEAVRLSMDSEGYQLAIPIEAGNVNGISNDEPVRNHIVNKFAPFVNQNQVYKKFSPKSHMYNFSNQHSRAYNKLSVKPVLPAKNLKENLSVSEKFEPTYQSGRVDLWSAINSTFPLKDSSQVNDKLLYVGITEKLIQSGMPIDPQFDEYIEKWVSDKSTPIKLRNRIVTFYMENEPSKVRPLLPTFSGGQLKNLLQNWKQTKRISKAADFYFWQWRSSIDFTLKDVRRLNLDLSLSDSLWNHLLNDVSNESIDQLLSKLDSADYFGIIDLSSRTHFINSFILTDLYIVVETKLREGKKTLNKEQLNALKKDLADIKSSIEDKIETTISNYNFLAFPKELINFGEIAANHVGANGTIYDDLILLKLYAKTIKKWQLERHKIKVKKYLGSVAIAAIGYLFYSVLSHGDFESLSHDTNQLLLDIIAPIGLSLSAVNFLIYSTLGGSSNIMKIAVAKARVKQGKAIYRSIKAASKGTQNRPSLINRCKALFRPTQ